MCTILSLFQSRRGKEMFHYLVSISWFHHGSIVDRAFLYFFSTVSLIHRHFVGKFDSFPRQIRNAEWSHVRLYWPLVGLILRLRPSRVRSPVDILRKLTRTHARATLRDDSASRLNRAERAKFFSRHWFRIDFPTWDRSAVLEEIREARERSYLCLERVIYSRN